MRFLALLTLFGCPGGSNTCPIGDDIDGEDRLAVCAGTVESCETSAQIGTGSGGVFREFDEAEAVALDVAPQGGFGVSIKVRTVGLIAGDTAVADITLDVLRDGTLAGTHTQPVSLLCQDNGEGEVFGVVVGFDTADFSTNDDLLILDGETVTLRVTLTDAVGTSTTAESNVTIDVGG